MTITPLPMASLVSLRFGYDSDKEIENKINHMKERSENFEYKRPLNQAHFLEGLGLQNFERAQKMIADLLTQLANTSKPEDIEQITRKLIAAKEAALGSTVRVDLHG